MVDEQLIGRRWKAARHILAKDPASRSHGVEIVDVTENSVEVIMPTGVDDSNGVGITHGGLSYFLADTAVGIASNLGEDTNVTSSATVTYLAPGPLGETLRAICTGPVAGAGRTSIYRTEVTREDGQSIVVVQSTMMKLGRPKTESEQ
jgi:acyl-CoA thioesterase